MSALPLPDQPDGTPRAPTDDRARRLLSLKAAAPLRGPAAQVNELDTPLFGAASSPGLF